MTALTQQQLDRLIEECVGEARRTLVGRRFLPIHGPLRPGQESVRRGRLAGEDPALIDLTGSREDTAPIVGSDRTMLSIPFIYKDFHYHFREVEEAQAGGTPLDPGAAVRAARSVAEAEDQLIFNGNKEMGIEGLLSASDRGRLKRSDWSAPGNAYGDVVRGIETLLEGGHHGPFALVLAMDLYAQTITAHSASVVLDIDQLSKLCEKGVHASVAVPTGSAVLVSTGKQNLDLAVARDLGVLAFPSRGPNLVLRVHESLVLRVRRPGSICTIEP